MSCLRSLRLFTYSCDQHVQCCDFVFVWCLVYGGDQHILCCVFCFVCLRLVSSVPNLHVCRVVRQNQRPFVTSTRALTYT